MVVDPAPEHTLSVTPFARGTGRLEAWAVRQPWLPALLCGALAACGFQPLANWPAMAAGTAGLMALLLTASSARRAVLIGWVWGVGHFTLGIAWIATAFSYQAKMPVWLGWLAVVGLALYLAVYPALAALGGWLARRHRTGFVLAFAGCWIIAEWLRGWVCTGFPGNTLAVALLGDFGHPGLAALTPWLGTYALSGLAVLLAGLLVLMPERRRARDGRYWVAIGMFVAAVPLPHFLGHGGAAGGGAEGHIPFTLVQPNIAQEVLDDPAHFEAGFQSLAGLSRLTRPGVARLVLWPESGVPDYLRDGYPRWAYAYSTYAADPAIARWRIGKAIGPGSLLLTGAVDLEFSGGEVSGARNVVTALDSGGQITGGYTKVHLVPYGEYLPMRGLLSLLGIARLVPGDIDFHPGSGPRTLDLGPLGRVGVQICYEIEFPGAVVDAAHRPDYIFNPFNDGWFGSSGPPQHLAEARLRAIEEGLPVLRATTNGISAVIDADGIVRRYALRGTARRIDGLVPPAHAPTLFARMGNPLSLLWAIGLLGLAMLVLRRAER